MEQGFPAKAPAVVVALLLATTLLGCDDSCQQGFALEGETCVDVDECLGQGQGHNCHADAACTNSAGSFSCACEEGYQGDGLECMDIDECQEGTHGCSPNATCSNTPGSHACACNQGYDGNGQTCTDINECEDGHNCAEHASCENLDGSFQCACNDGYEGDGVSCERIREAGLVLAGATVIDGTGSEASASTMLAVVGDRIVEVAQSIHIYPDDTVLDLEGHYVVPGVINAHAHGTSSMGALEAWAQAGVTTVRDLGANLYPPGSWEDIYDWDDWAAAILGGAEVNDYPPPAIVERDENQSDPQRARLLLSGPLLTATNGYPNNAMALQINSETVTEDGQQITPEEDARRKTQLLIDAGADVIKIGIENHWNNQPWGLLTEDQVAAIVEVAHAAGLRVTAHVSADERLTTCIDADPHVDEAAHIVTDTMSDENITAMVDQGIALIPTLQVWESLSWICESFEHCEEAANLGRFLDAGGLIALGDDYGNPGIELGMPIAEMELLAAAGMTNMEIIVAATQNGAIVCDLEADLGTLEQGKLADIIILSEDPQEDITALAAVTHVIRNGEVIRSPE